jgi:hypothetical protein
MEYIVIKNIGFRSELLKGKKISEAYESFSHINKATVKLAWEKVNPSKKKTRSRKK